VTYNVLTRLARGDVVLSISLTAASSLVAFITVPWLVTLALAHLAKTETQISLSPWESVATLFSTTALPLAQ